MSNRYTGFSHVQSEARRQLDSSTDVAAMVNAADTLRELDPEHPVVAALEARLRHAFEINFAAIRTRLAAGVDSAA